MVLGVSPPGPYCQAPYSTQMTQDNSRKVFTKQFSKQVNCDHSLILAYFCTFNSFFDKYLITNPAQPTLEHDPMAFQLFAVLYQF